MCVKKRDYPLSRQVEAKQDEGKEIVEEGRRTIILLSWNKVQKQQNKTVERTRLVTILELCEVTLYLCARLPQPEVWTEVLFWRRIFVASLRLPV